MLTHSACEACAAAALPCSFVAVMLPRGRRMQPTPMFILTNNKLMQHVRCQMHAGSPVNLPQLGVVCSARQLLRPRKDATLHHTCQRWQQSVPVGLHTYNGRSSMYSLSSLFPPSVSYELLARSFFRWFPMRPCRPLVRRAACERVSVPLHWMATGRTA